MSDDLDEIQGDVLDLRSQTLASLTDAIENAESCETSVDLRANLAEAVDHAKTLLDSLRELHKRATRTA